MLKKKLLAMGLSLVVAIGIVGCNGGEFEEQPNDQTAPEAPADDAPADDA